MIRITKTISVRIPEEIMSFMEDTILMYPKFKNRTDVILHALKNLMEEKTIPGEIHYTQSSNLDFIHSNITPKHKLAAKINSDSKFRKREYDIAGILTVEQLEDYKQNYEELGMSLQDYYKTHVEGK